MLAQLLDVNSIMSKPSLKMLRIDLRSIIDALQEIGNLLEKTRMQPRLSRAEQFIVTIFIGSKYYVMISLYTSHIIFHIRFQVTACG
jgi:hypothetical protein